MNHDTPLGSRIAQVHNGSSLFTGDAGQGESNIRRWILENDWLEAIIALPLNMFYNTAIATYVWVLSNRKPEHRLRTGLSPYVRIREARGVATRRGSQLLEEAAHRLATEPPQRAPHAPVPASPAPGGVRTPGEVYAHYAARILPRYPNPDVSKLDWMVCCDMASNNLAIDARYLEQALREGSPRLAEERKRGHVDDYVARTARNVMQDADVVDARGRLASGDGTLQLGS